MLINTLWDLCTHIYLLGKILGVQRLRKMYIFKKKKKGKNKEEKLLAFFRWIITTIAKSVSAYLLSVLLLLLLFCFVLFILISLFYFCFCLFGRYVCVLCFCSRFHLVKGKKKKKVSLYSNVPWQVGTKLNHKS